MKIGQWLKFFKANKPKRLTIFTIPKGLVEEYGTHLTMTIDDIVRLIETGDILECRNVSYTRVIQYLELLHEHEQISDEFYQQQVQRYTRG